MLFALTGAALSAACYKWGNWRDWRKYYPTILFFMIGNETCELLMYRKPLWEYTDFFGVYMAAMIGLMVLMYPATVILFLTHYPQKLLHQSLYVAAWTALFMLVEILSLSAGLFVHHDGWSLLYTAAHDVIMFLLLRLHFKKPLLAWPAVFVLAFSILWFFRLPLEIMR